jgi:hypothetical protein
MRIGVLFLALFLFGCAGGDDVRPAPIRERRSGPITLNRPTPRETQQCFADLSRAQIRY